MKGLIAKLLAVSLCAAPACAADRPLVPLKLSARDLLTISRALDAIPFPDAIDTIVNVTSQIDAETQAQIDAEYCAQRRGRDPINCQKR